MDNVKHNRLIISCTYFKRRRGNDDSKSKTTKLKQLLIFARQYIATLRDNLTSCFNCRTITIGSLVNLEHVVPIDVPLYFSISTS